MTLHKIRTFASSLDARRVITRIPELAAIISSPETALQLGNLAIRVISLAARFLLILILARALAQQDFGYFTLIQTTTIIVGNLLGLEFNAFSRREIVIAADPVLKTRHVRDQLLFSTLMGLNAIWFAYGAALAHQFPIEVAHLVALVIFTELVSQEGIRILYALQRMVMGNIAWFVRSSVWVFLLIAMLVWNPGSITLHNVLVIWIVFAAAATALLAWALRQMAWRDAWRSPIDWAWMQRGILVAMPFFVSSVFVNILSYVPRYVLFYFRGAEETAIFGLYSGIAVGIVNLLCTSVIPAGMARAVHSYAHDSEAGFRAEIGKLWLQTGAITITVSAGLAVAFPFVLPFTGEGKYPMDWPLLLLLEIAFAAQLASLVSQVSLYAKHRDRDILIGTVAAGSLSVVLQIAGAHLAGMHGLAAAMALSMLALTLIYFRFDARAPHSQGKDAV